MIIEREYKFKTDELAGKVILITGANRGLGKSVALDLAKAGAIVILLGRDLAQLEQVYDEIIKLKYPQPAIYPLDLEGANPNDYVQLAQNIEKNYQKLDGVIHNAAILGYLTPIEYFEIDIWYKTMQINLNAVFLLTQQSLSLLKKSTYSRILFVSSGAGRVGYAYFGAYAVSKFALEGFMQVLANELENTSIRVNTVAPGVLQTQMRKNAYPAEDFSKNTQPSEISSAFVYLMSKKANHIHNKQLVIS